MRVAEGWASTSSRWRIRLDDQVENIPAAIVRGAGVPGLVGIWPERQFGPFARDSTFGEGAEGSSA